MEGRRKLQASGCARRGLERATFFHPILASGGNLRFNRASQFQTRMSQDPIPDPPPQTNPVPEPAAPPGGEPPGPDATPEEKDLWWFRNVYQGDHVPQLTFRAVLMGGLLGMLMAVSN